MSPISLPSIAFGYLKPLWIYIKKCKSSCCNKQEKKTLLYTDLDSTQFVSQFLVKVHVIELKAFLTY